MNNTALRAFLFTKELHRNIPEDNADEIEALLLSSDSAERSTPASLSKIVSLLGFHENLVSRFSELFLPEGPSLEIWKNPQNESIVVHVDGSNMIQLGRVGVASAPSSFPNTAEGGSDNSLIDASPPASARPKQPRPPGGKSATKYPATTAAPKKRARSKSLKGGNEKVPRRKQKTIPTLVNATNMPSELSAKRPVPSTSIDPEIAVVGSDPCMEIPPDQPALPKRARGRPSKCKQLPAAELTVGEWISSLSLMEMKKCLQFLNAASTGDKAKLAMKLKMALDVDDSSLAASTIPQHVLNVI